ncbi:MAG: hypothetical protein PHU36_10225 [Syntrophomonadaceae bacterium]|nr:hypothetical protein [Syntrophomonadaceae bacterium]
MKLTEEERSQVLELVKKAGADEIRGILAENAADDFADKVNEGTKAIKERKTGLI